MGCLRSTAGSTASTVDKNHSVHLEAAVTFQGAPRFLGNVGDIECVFGKRYMYVYVYMYMSISIYRHIYICMYVHIHTHAHVTYLCRYKPSERSGMIVAAMLMCSWYQGSWSWLQSLFPPTPSIPWRRLRSLYSPLENPIYPTAASQRSRGPAFRFRSGFRGENMNRRLEPKSHPCWKSWTNDKTLVFNLCHPVRVLQNLWGLPLGPEMGWRR